MNCRDYQDAIQELADGTLGPVRRAELQTHLDLCDACRALANDLQTIRAAAPTIAHVPPADHVWMQIAGRLRQEGHVHAAPLQRTRHAALLAIAATLLLAVAGAIWVLLPRQQQSPAAVTAGQTPDGNAADTDVVQSIVDEFAEAEKHYQTAIAKLQEAASSDQDVIDAETAAVLQKNLQVIDQAITESRAALKSEPQSAPARDSLFEALRRKVTLLQDTIALMNEMRRGNSAGAARLMDGKS